MVSGVRKEEVMHQHVEAPPTKEEKREAFDAWYAGWDAFMRDRSPRIPEEAGWRPECARRFHEGHGAAAAAAERFRAGTPVRGAP